VVGSVHGKTLELRPSPTRHDAGTLGEEVAATRPERRVPWFVDVAGLAWVAAAAMAVMLPALVHGVYLGEYDWLAANGLPHQSGVTIPNSDRILQMMPWTTVAWTQVHHGHLPLWNSYNALGTPLAFNWQSSVFSLPALVGYLVPMRLAYTVQVLVTLVVAGSGVYVLCRVLRLRPLACVFAGTVFELSGSFMGWLGWPVASVVSWTGWIFAATILVVRGTRRVRSIVLFSITLALAVYAGQPDTLAPLVILLVLFAAVLLALKAKSAHDPGALRRPFGDLALASIAGLAISAPLLLPGLQLTSQSIRDVRGGALGSQLALSLSTLQSVVFPGLGQPPPFWVHVYLGVVAASLAVAATVSVVLARPQQSRQPEFVALIVVAVGAALLTFVQPVISVMNSLPGLEAVRFPRVLICLEFAIAVLAGVGLDLLLRFYDRRSVVLVTGASFLAAGLVLTALLVLEPSGDVNSRSGLAWTAAGTVLGLGLVGLLELARRRGPDGSGGGGRMGTPRRTGLLVAVVLLAFESVFLVTTGGSIWPSSPRGLTVTSAEQELQETVGSSLVGTGLPSCSTLGFTPNTNIFFGIHEMMAYDPTLPRAYFQVWLKDTGQVPGLPYVSSFCPGFTTAAQARTYGVPYVLELHGSAGPKGAIFVKEIGGEDLYRVPGSAMATLTPEPVSGRLAGGAPGAGVPVSWPAPNSVRIASDAATAQVLRIRLTDVPGWHATIDGRPLHLETFDGIMLQARVPPGRHVVALTYWPDRFSAGIVLAVLGCAGLVALMIGAGLRKRRAPAPAPAPAAGDTPPAPGR
jgi:hypothetical protein